MIDHTLSLTPDGAVSIMDDLSLITPETFDRFVIAVLSWYREESFTNDKLPNLFELVEDHDPYTKIFYDLFVESLAFRYSYHDDQIKDKFDQEAKRYFSQLFRDNLGVLYELMIYDYERLLRGLNLVYIWDSLEYGNGDFILKNEAICEVW